MSMQINLQHVFKFSASRTHTCFESRTPLVNGCVLITERHESENICQFINPNVRLMLSGLFLLIWMEHCKLRIQVSQSSFATDLRWGGRFNTNFVRSRFENSTVKELLKSVYICQSYCKNKSGTFFWDTVYSYAIVDCRASVQQWWRRFCDGKWKISTTMDVRW